MSISKIIFRQPNQACGISIGMNANKRGKQETDITGQVFGELTALHRDLTYVGKNRKWFFHCACGKDVVMFKHNVTSGNVTSCCGGSYERRKEREKQKWTYRLSQIDDKSLTTRQKQIADMLRSGLTQAEVADKLKINQSTVCKAVVGTTNPEYQKNFGGILKKTLDRKLSKNKEKLNHQVLSKQKIIESLIKQRDAQRAETNQLSQLIRDLQEEVFQLTEETQVNPREGKTHGVQS